MPVGSMPGFLRGQGRRERRRRRSVLIVLTVGLVYTLLVTFVQPFVSIQWWVSDQLYLPTSASPNIVIVAVDDETLARYGKWSDWPRSLHAQAIENLNEARAMVIGYDIIFADESYHDSELARALERADNVVLSVVGVEPLPPQGPNVVYRDFLLPTPSLAQGASAMGHANVVPDGDGIVRRIPLAAKDTDGEVYPALIMSVLHEFFVTPMPEAYAIDGGALHLLDRTIPVDGKTQMRINFVDKPGSFTRLSYGDVIEGRFDPDVVKHKIVLVGMTATGEPDSWVTPMSAEKMYGVEIHASAIDTILRQRFLAESSAPVTAGLVLAMVGLAGVALPILRLRWGVLAALALFAAYLVGAFFAFDSGYVIDVLYPLLALPIVCTTVIFLRVVAVRADRQQMKDLFGRYVSKEVAGEILTLAGTDQLKLGGVRRETTVLFADLRGFTTLSENRDPEEVVSILNSRLSLIIERILANKGMINKFAGDAIMAVWNAPQDQSGHALLAVKSALEAQERLGALHGGDGAGVQFGMGVNTGQVVAGNVGTEGRSEYTIIGDAVNLASRLCSGAPGGQVWIGYQTYEEVKDIVDVEELGPQTFKGKAEQVLAYRVTRIHDQRGDE